MVKNSYFRSLLKKKDSDTIIFAIGILIAIICILISLIFNIIVEQTGYYAIKDCGLRRLVGLYCPGCGGTRAFYYLIHGNIFNSIKYNPFTIYFVVIALVFYVSQIIRFVSRGRFQGLHLNKWFAIAGIIIIAINFFVKNIALIFFHYQIIP